MIAGSNTNAQMFHPLYSTDQLSAVSTSLYPAALQSIRPNEVPVGGGGRYHWYTPNPTQPNPTTVGAHHTAAGIWGQTIAFDTKNYFGALQCSRSWECIKHMMYTPCCNDNGIFYGMQQLYFSDSQLCIGLVFTMCVKKYLKWEWSPSLRIVASKGVSVKVTVVCYFFPLWIIFLLCYDMVQMCLFDISNFHLTFTSSKMLNI